MQIGPTFIHGSKTFESYFKLPSGMLKLNKKLKDIRAYGTDSEVNISESCTSCFQKGYHLLCDINMRDNITSNLTELHISGALARSFIGDIFGRVIGSYKHKGLVDVHLFSERGHAPL